MFLRRIIAILISIIVIAAGLQFLRSLGMFNLIKNVNAEISLKPAKKLSIDNDELKNKRFEKYLILVDEHEENSLNIAFQLQKTLDYLKKEYSIIDCTQLPMKFNDDNENSNSINLDNKSNDKSNEIKNKDINNNINKGEENNSNKEVELSSIEYLNNFDSVFITFERLNKIFNFKVFLDYVNNGGSLILLERPIVDKTFKEYASYFGIKSFKDKLNDNVVGIKVLSDFMIGAKGFETKSNEIRNSSIALTLTDNNNLKIHLSSYLDIPICWEYSYGKGKFLIFNGTALNEKQNRGVISCILSLAKSDFIYPIANIKMVHIDDFPSPIPQGIDEKIFDEFSRNIEQFYKEIWWPDMLNLSRKYDVKYSNFIIENYNNITKQPFEKATSSTMKNLMLFGREILANHGEIGLHGYNHQSLALAGYVKQNLGYNPWDSLQDMKASIEELIRFIHSVFGHYKLQAYVPPSNILSPEGRNAVKFASNDIKIIASVYLPNLEGDVYAQEFEVADDGIIEFPRITAGYQNNPMNMWMIYNAINLYGIFAHFVHPDDVLDFKRNENKSWTELREEFEEILKEISLKFSWLRSFTISPASIELVKYLECKPLIEYKLNENKINIYIENFRENIYCILKTEKQILNSAGCEYKKIQNNAYLLEIKESFSSLEVK